MQHVNPHGSANLPLNEQNTSKSVCVISSKTAERLANDSTEITAAKLRIGRPFTTIYLNVCRHLSFVKAIVSDKG